ncbi:hypothetical protein [Pseudanabaena minima]|uniref:hypothetical protein n=1 Tax=Pseudanabaena minima TaxID=890415 RepID=UPI003DAA2711
MAAQSAAILFLGFMSSYTWRQLYRYKNQKDMATIGVAISFWFLCLNGTCDRYTFSRQPAISYANSICHK